MLRLRSEKLQVFSLPTHRIVDAVPSAGWSKKIHSSTAPDSSCDTRRDEWRLARIRRADGCVQAVHIGFVFVGANVVLKNGVYTNPRIVPREHQRSTAVSPIPRIFIVHPSGKGAFERQRVKQKTSRGQREAKNVLGNVVQHVVAISWP